MKNLILSTLFVLSCVIVSAQDSQDYNWTVQGDSNFMYVSGDGYSGGDLSVMALYNFTDKLQAGASFGFGFGDFEYDAAIAAAARYFVTDSMFAYASLPLTDTAGDGLTVGAGKRYKLGDRVEFNPTALYQTEAEAFSLVMGFAVRL